MQRGNIWIYTVCLFDEMTDSAVSMQVCEVWLRAETSPQDRKWCAFIKTPPQSLNAYRCHNVIDSITRRVTERQERAKGRERKKLSLSAQFMSLRWNLHVIRGKISQSKCHPPPAVLGWALMAQRPISVKWSSMQGLSKGQNNFRLRIWYGERRKSGNCVALLRFNAHRLTNVRIKRSNGGLAYATNIDLYGFVLKVYFCHFCLF